MPKVSFFYRLWMLPKNSRLRSVAYLENKKSKGDQKIGKWTEERTEQGAERKVDKKEARTK